MPPLGKAAVPRSGSLADHENVAAKADEEQIARAVLAEGRDLAQRPRVGREILIPPRETRRREGLAGNEAREGHCPNIARNEVGEDILRSEEHTSELQSLMRISYAVFCLKKKK